MQVGSITRTASKPTPRYDKTDVSLLSGEDELVSLDVGREHQHASGFSVKVFQPRVIGSALMQIERWTRETGPVT